MTEFAALLTLAALLSQPQPTAVEPAAQPAPAITLQPTEIDAVGWALGSLATYPADAQPFVRFVWLPPWATFEWHGALDFAVNASASQARTLHRGMQHAGGYLLAYDLTRLASGKQLARLVELWDGLATRDPYFHVSEVNVEQISCSRCGGDGKLSTTSRSASSTCPDCSGTGKISRPGKRVAILAPHLESALAVNAADPQRSERIDVLVTQLTRSTGAIYRADWLIEQLLTSDVGLYPEFRQIDLAGGLDKHLERRGFSRQQAIDVGGEKGCFLERSGVTGKQRIVLAFHGPGSRTPAIQTFDLADANVRPQDQFIRNLVNFENKSDASEVFVPLANGLIEYLLTDGNGVFQRTAPDVIVSDSTKPDGFTTRLEMGMSCVICHHVDQGYKTAKNDLDYLFGSDIDFAGEDISTLRRGEQIVLARQEIVDLVVSRYAEGLLGGDNILARARRDYETAIARITDYQITAEGQTPVQRVGEQIRQIYHGYRYAQIDATRTLLELGVVTDGGDPLAVLSQLVPAPPAGTEEDVQIGLHRAGLKLNRSSFEAIYSDLAARAALTRPALTTLESKP